MVERNLWLEDTVVGREFYGKIELNGLYSKITRYAISGIIDSAGDSKTENHFIAQNNDS